MRPKKTISESEKERVVQRWLECRNVSQVTRETGYSDHFITMWLEERELFHDVICDYCSIPIPRGKRKKYGVQETMEGMKTSIGFYFCSEECRKKWIDNE